MVEIPGFEIQEKLGAGGMAEVWKARQVSLDRIVAIKILSAQFSQEAEDVKRFQQEAQAAAKLKHTGIVQVYDANAINGTYYFVMEYVAGYTAGEWLRRKGVVPEKDALLVAECVADALAYAWDTARVVHCDIKPDNIMVDADGSVKVTDLGLARTISAMSARGLTEEVLGTPAYMSPEQARGETDLDFHADIYSLGATVYHLLTGKLLFQGNPEERVMEMQVSDTVPDPKDVNPSLSKAVSWLLEKMLAKDRQDRYESWQALRSDVARVRSGMMPHGRLAPKSVSTVTRSSKRLGATVNKAKKHTAIAPVAVAPRRAVPLRVLLLLVIGLAALLVTLLLKLIEGQMYTASQPTGGVSPPPVNSTVEQEPADAQAAEFKEMFERTKQWVTENPGRYEESIARYRIVVKKATGTLYEDMAKDVARRAIRDLTDARALDLERTTANIRNRAEALAKEQGPGAAASYMETYSGPFMLDTQRVRLEEAAAYRQQHNATESAKVEKVKRVEEKYVAVLDGIANSILDVGIESARGILVNAMADADLAGKTAAFAPLRKLLDDAVDMDNRIINSFGAQCGETVTVMLSNNSTKTFNVESVSAGQVVGTLKVGVSAVVTVRFGAKDLAVRERLQRMGSDSDPAVGLVKGQMAFAAKAYDKASKYFESLPAEIKERLLARISKVESAPSAASNLEGDDGAVAAVAPVAVAPPVVVVKPPPRRTQMSRIELAAADAVAAKAVQGLLQGNKVLAEQDISLFAGPDGQTAGIEIRSPDVSDLSPLAPLKSLRSLSCGVSGRPGQLVSLQALRGLRLERLCVSDSMVRDLSVLKGMPLLDLNLDRTQVQDLEPLRGGSLERLSIVDTKVKDFTPLRGMPLVSLNMHGSQAFDFMVLSALPIENLNLCKTQFRDLSLVKSAVIKDLDISFTRTIQFQPLRDMPLESLSLAGTQIRDLAVLQGKGIKCLNLCETGVSDLTPLKGMQLNRLYLANTLVKDLGCLKGMPLRELDISSSHVENLAALEGMPLEVLRAAHTGVGNLDPLANTPLRELDVQGSRVQDLDIASKVPLKVLNCQKARVKNLASLRRTGIEYLWIDNVDESSRAILKSMPKLRTVNGTPWARW
jgi:serine/threonine-protein kinase